MPCTCRGTGAGVVITGENGVTVRGAGTAAAPFRISTSLADALVFEVRDSSTVNMTITGTGTVIDPYVLRADTGSVTALTSLSDVISDAPDPGSVPTWVAASGGTPGHWEFLVPDIPDAATTVPTTALTGIVQDANLPPRISQYGQLLAVGTDLNTVFLHGWYRGYNLVNPPVAYPGAAGNWWHIEVFGHDVTWITQVAYSYNSTSTTDPPTQWLRRSIGGTATPTWTPWLRLLSSGDVAAKALQPYHPFRDVKADVSEVMLPFASASGNVAVNAVYSGGGGFYGQKDVTFPAGRFDVAPSVVVSMEDATAGSGKVTVVPGSVTTTGCSVYVWRTVSNSAVKVYFNARTSRSSA